MGTVLKRVRKAVTDRQYEAVAAKLDGLSYPVIAVRLGTDERGAKRLCERACDRIVTKGIATLEQLAWLYRPARAA